MQYKTAIAVTITGSFVLGAIAVSGHNTPQALRPNTAVVFAPTALPSTPYVPAKQYKSSLATPLMSRKEERALRLTQSPEQEGDAIDEKSSEPQQEGDIPATFSIVRPVITSGDTIEFSGKKVQLAFISAPGPALVCEKGNGEAKQHWPCGMAARTALRAFAGRFRLECESLRGSTKTQILARCKRGQIDLAHWLVAQGWAHVLDSASQDLRYLAVSAHKNKRGIWKEDIPNRQDLVSARLNDVDLIYMSEKAYAHPAQFNYPARQKLPSLTSRLDVQAQKGADDLSDRRVRVSYATASSFEFGQVEEAPERAPVHVLQSQKRSNKQARQQKRQKKVVRQNSNSLFMFNLTGSPEENRRQRKRRLEQRLLR
ncbi:thermonuclease family protein [Polycladidibacter stylochi]|uniref:thermonuclease family protein n=1 Tax=Polycladidibacter stylochi TaxID=1807766 RepID=UPI00082BC7BC|nr:thermonuclease family protein [Pseudovibrio stylochi]